MSLVYVRDDAKDRVFGQPACENLMGEFLFDAGTQIRAPRKIDGALDRGSV